MAVSSGGDIKLKVVIDYDTQGGNPLREVDGGIKGIHQSSSALSGTLGGMKGLLLEALPAFGIAAVGAAFLNVVDSATKLDKGVREIGTLMGGLTDGEIKRMKAELGALSIASGQAIEPLVKARYDIVSSGFTDAADSALILETSARLAVAGVTQVSTAADVLTTVISAYGMKASEVGAVSDDLFTIVKLGKTTMDDLGSQFGVLAAVASPAGVSVHEAGAALAALTVQGQSTSVSVTGISAAIMELQKPSKEMQKALASIGVESDNLIKSGGGLKGALDLVAQASEMSGVSVNKLFMREEALRAVLPLTGTAAKAFADDLKEMENNAGATDTAFNQMALSSAFLQDQAWAAFNDVKNKIGEAIIDSDLFKESLIGVKDGIIALGVASGAVDTPISKMSDLDRGLRTAWLMVESLGLSFVALGQIIGGVVKWAVENIRPLRESIFLISTGLNSLVLVYENYMLTGDKARLMANKVAAEAKANSAEGVAARKSEADARAALNAVTLQAEKRAKALAEELRKNTIVHKENSGAVAGHARTVEDVAIKSAAWTEALRDSADALSGASKETMTLAQAEENVQRAFQASLASQKMSIAHKREITEATREYLAAKSDQKRLEQEVNDALVRGNEVLALGQKNTVSVTDATRKHAVAVVDLKAAIVINSDASLANAETKADLERKSRAATDAFRVETDAVRDQGEALGVAADDVSKAYTALTGTTLRGADAMARALQGFNGDLRSTADLASAAGVMIGGSFGNTISTIAAVAKAIYSISGALDSVSSLAHSTAEAIGLVSSAKQVAGLSGGSGGGGSGSQGFSDSYQQIQYNPDGSVSPITSGFTVGNGLTVAGGAYGLYESTKTGGLGGALGGAASGAAIGSVIPVVGTLVGGIIGGIAGLFSDPRLKENVVPTGLNSNGFALYDYSYKADRDHQRYRGVMSPEVRRRRPDAVGRMGGYDFVDYGRLGIPFQRVPRYAAGGLHRGGLAVVGDGGGPELVDLPAGSRVYSNNESKGMVDFSGLQVAVERQSVELGLLREDLVLALSMVVINTRSTVDQLEISNFAQGVGS